MGVGQRLLLILVDQERQHLAEPPAIDENQGRAVSPDDLLQLFNQGPPYRTPPSLLSLFSHESKNKVVPFTDRGRYDRNRPRDILRVARLSSPSKSSHKLCHP